MDQILQEINEHLEYGDALIDGLDDKDKVLMESYRAQFVRWRQDIAGMHDLARRKLLKIQQATAQLAERIDNLNKLKQQAEQEKQPQAEESA